MSTNPSSPAIWQRFFAEIALGGSRGADSQRVVFDLDLDAIALLIQKNRWKALALVVDLEADARLGCGVGVFNFGLLDRWRVGGR